MEAKNIMICLDNFLKKEESKELFSMLGKTITVEDGWITMRKGRKKRKFFFYKMIIIEFVSKAKILLLV